MYNYTFKSEADLKDLTNVLVKGLSTLGSFRIGWSSTYKRKTSRSWAEWKCEF